MGIIDPAPDSPPALDKIIKNIIITIPIHFFIRLCPNSFSILGIKFSSNMLLFYGTNEEFGAKWFILRFKKFNSFAKKIYGIIDYESYI